MKASQLERYATRRNKIEAKIKALQHQLSVLHDELNEKKDHTFSTSWNHPAYGIPTFKITRYEPASDGISTLCIPVEGEEVESI